MTCYCRYMRQLMNVIDVVAIVPFYVEQSTSSGSSIAIVRVLRLARMLRIFKASKYNEGTRLLSETIWRSIPALSLLFFFTALGVVLFGSLIYFMEGGKFEVTAEYPHGAYMRTDVVGVSEVSPYTSIPVSCYWVIVTATTVGFGDLYPTSSGGRFVACICMYIGLLVLALPITVVGSNFSMVYEVNSFRVSYDFFVLTSINFRRKNKKLMMKKKDYRLPDLMKIPLRNKQRRRQKESHPSHQWHQLT